MHNSSDTRYLPVIRIGEVAKILHMSTSTLRQYEDLGIVLPFKEDSGQRMYSPEDIEWLRKLHVYFAETHTGPTALARLLRLMPSHAMRRRRNRPACNLRSVDKICWQIDPSLRRKCRDCPAYVEKEAVLEFEKYFGIFLLTDSS